MYPHLGLLLESDTWSIQPFPLLLAVASTQRSAEACPGAKMRWDRCELDGLPKIIFLYKVDIFGWPPDIRFECPSKMSVRSVETILRGLRKGTIWFAQLHSGTVEEYAQESGSDGLTRSLYTGRSDIGEKRALRPPETASKRKTRKPVKTSRYVMDDE